MGIVIEDLSQAARVNQVVGQFQDLVMGRIGVPDHARAMAVIGLLVRGGSVQVGAFAARLGNIPGVQVKSAMTKERKEISHEKAAEILQISPFDLVDIYLNLGIIYMLV